MLVRLPAAVEPLRRMPVLRARHERAFRTWTKDETHVAPPQLIGPLCAVGRFARCAHPSCEAIVRDWREAIISRLPYRAATLP